MTFWTAYKSGCVVLCAAVYCAAFYSNLQTNKERDAHAKEHKAGRYDCPRRTAAVPTVTHGLGHGRSGQTPAEGRRVPPPVKAAQWSPELHRTLGICLAAEVGVDTGERPNRAAEQVAVLGALVKRWHRRQRVDPELQLIDHAIAYCRVFEKREGSRRPWLLELSYDGDIKPKSWPSNLSWSRYARHWRDTLQRVTDWQSGTIATPCASAEHWGNVALGDHPKPNMRLLGCGGQGRAFANQFYSVTTGRMKL